MQAMHFAPHVVQTRTTWFSERGYSHMAEVQNPRQLVRFVVERVGAVRMGAPHAPFHFGDTPTNLDASSVTLVCLNIDVRFSPH